VSACLFQDVAAELGEDLGNLAEQVIAVGAREGSQVQAVPAAPTVVSGGGPFGQWRHLGGETRSRKNGKESRPWPLRLRTRCGVDRYQPPVSRSSMSPMLQTSVPGTGGASIQPSGAAICSPPLSSWARRVTSPRSRQAAWICPATAAGNQAAGLYETSPLVTLFSLREVTFSAWTLAAFSISVMRPTRLGFLAYYQVNGRMAAAVTPLTDVGWDWIDQLTKEASNDDSLYRVDRPLQLHHSPSLAGANGNTALYHHDHGRRGRARLPHAVRARSRGDACRQGSSLAVGPGGVVVVDQAPPINDRAFAGPTTRS